MIAFLFPIGDENPCERKPYWTWGLMALLTALSLALVARGAPTPTAIPWFLAPFCASTLADYVLAMLFLWVFADNVEDRFGWVFPVAILAWSWLGLGVSRLELAPQTALRGAVYGVSGVVGAYVTFFPRHYVQMVNLLYARRRSLLWNLFADDRPDHATVHVRAFWVAGIWPLVLLVLSLLDSRLGFLGGLAAGFAGAASAWAGRKWFGITVADPTIPEELAPSRRERSPRASRTSAKPEPEAPAPAPAHDSAAGPAAGGSFLEVEDRATAPAEEVPNTGRTGCAVIRLTEELADVSDLGRIVAGHTGEYFADVTRRIRVTRGLLVRRIDPEAARQVVEDLAARGIASAAVDLARTPELPPPSLLAGAGCSAQGCEFEPRDAPPVKLPWSRLALIAAGQFESRRMVPGQPRPAIMAENHIAGAPAEYVEKTQLTTMIDFVARGPRARYRLCREDTNFRLMAAQTQADAEAEGGFRGFVRALVRNRGATPVNTGVKVLDGGGKWGYLRFRAERDFDDYCWWLCQLLAWRKNQAQRTAFLE